MVQGPLRTADAARRAAALPHYVSSVAPEDLDASVTYDLAWFQVLYRQRARCVAVRWGGEREGGRERAISRINVMLDFCLVCVRERVSE